MIRSLILTPLAVLALPAFAAPPDSAGFAKIVQPFMQDHCVKCHGPEKQKGKLRLDTLANDFSDPAAVAKWAEVVNAINGQDRKSTRLNSSHRH